MSTGRFVTTVPKGCADLQESSRWTAVDFDDKPRLQRCTEILRLVSELYEKADVDALVRPWMKLRDGKIFLYQADDIEIVLALEFNLRRRLYFLKAVGFVGDPEVVASVTTRQLRRFLSERGETRCFGFLGQCNRYEPFSRFMDYMGQQQVAEITSKTGKHEYSVWNLVLT